MKTWPDTLDFTYAPEFKKEILAIVSKPDAITLNFENVERASLACIQVLIAAKNKAEKDSLDFKITLSPALEKIMQDLGLHHIFTTERT